MAGRTLWFAAAAVLGAATGLVAVDGEARQPTVGRLFPTSDACLACHNRLTASGGEDVSIGAAWRPTMMANSARDPYWHAAARRETLDHPSASGAIQDECSKCHMPMARYQAHARGMDGQIFTHLPIRAGGTEFDVLAADGVSCGMCHQIRADRLGQRASFTGGFVVETQRDWGQREVFGRFTIDRGRTRVMQSAARVRPRKGGHLQRSEHCATCHTLITHTLDAQGNVVAELPEQVPYLEWLHSSYRNRKSCQSCHTPRTRDSAPLSSVLPQPRADFGRHVFRGGNFFMLQLLNRYRGQLGVQALPQEYGSAVQRTLQHLGSAAATLSLACGPVADGRLEAKVTVRNLAGHKLPTAYPSRRVWIHFTVADASGKVVFESGAFAANGSIRGNDNDAHPDRYEPHHDRIDRSGQVQIYEAILAAPDDTITTGLLTASHYAKDNRVLPRGFDKQTARAEIAVHGKARSDASFRAGNDMVQYVVDVSAGQRPFQVSAELWYQPIGYRWAQNLGVRRTAEANRFLSYYRSLASGSAVVLTRASASVP